MSSTTYTVSQNLVASLYGSVLQRSGGDAEITAWANYLDYGQLSISNLISPFVSSTEAVNNVYPIVRMYQAFFGRAPDAAGLAGWVGLLESGTSLSIIAQAFAGSAEFAAGYGTNFNTTNFVTALYQNILGRQPDTAGLAGWVGVLGSSPGSDKIASVVMAFGQSAEFIADTSTGISTWLTSLATSAIANTLLNGTPSGANSSYYSGKNGATGTVVSGTTVTLTTGVDSVAGTTGTIQGLIDTVTSSNSTWTSADTINPVSGATFSLRLKSAATDGTVTSSLVTNGVTTLSLTPVNGVTAASFGFDVANISGLTAVTVTGAATTSALTGTVTLNSVPSSATLTIGNNGMYENVVFNLAASSSSSKTTTTTTGSVSLAVASGQAGDVVLASTGTGATTIALTTSGSGNALGGLTTHGTAGTPTDTTLTISGTGGLSLGGLGTTSRLDNTLNKIDATAETGTVFINANLQTDGGSFTGGKLAATAAGGSASPIASPAGSHPGGVTNTLVLTTNQSLTSANVSSSGFPTVLVDPTSASAISLDTTKLTGAVALGVTPVDSSLGSATVTFTNVTASVLQFASNDTVGGVAEIYPGVVWTLKTATGTADAVTINVNNSGNKASTGAVTIGSASTVNGLDVSGVETVTIATSGVPSVTINGMVNTSSTAMTVTLSGTAAVTINAFGGATTTCATTFVLGSHTAGDTINLASPAKSSGVDLVKNMNAGAGGDLIGFSVAGFTDVLLTESASASSTATSATSMALVAYSGLTGGALTDGSMVSFGTTVYTVATLQAAIRGGSAVTFGATPSAGAFLVAYTASDGVHIAEAQVASGAASTAAATVKDIVDLVGVSIGNLASANFHFTA